MIEQYEPKSWCVVFNREAESGWARWVPGRYKHVRAYAFIPASRTWLFYDVHFGGARVFAVPDGPDAHAAIYQFIGPEGVSDIVSVPVLPRRRRLFPWSNWCTTALRHLLNLPGSALRPDGFYRDCLDHGGKPFEETMDAPKYEKPPVDPAIAELKAQSEADNIVALREKTEIDTAANLARYGTRVAMAGSTQVPGI